jgi:autophagy-related protein 2
VRFYSSSRWVSDGSVGTTMFSQWATRQVVKFFLKRLLGRILRNNLDLEQLDVQLGWGTVQLKDLVLNTDYFNDQLGASSSLLLKQGSIGSVSAKISWRVLSEDQPCEIEIQDLELVVVPRDKGHVVHKENKDVEAAAADVFLVPLAGNEDTSSSIKGTDVAASYSSIQDGVRLVARMVEKVLLSMYVKVTNLVIHLEAQTHKGTSQFATLDPQHLVRFKTSQFATS